jgi:hypothetical protein
MMPKFYIFPFLLLSLLAGQAVHAQCSLTAAPTAVRCFGAADGRIDLTLTGTAPYNYIWSQNGTPNPPFSDASNALQISNLSPGLYAFTVTDNTGCTAAATALVTQPTAIALSTTVTNVSCFGGNDGFIGLTVTGGTPAYTYLWSDGSNGPNCPSPTLGIYTVTVTDANNCTATISATVTQPTALNPTVVVTPVSCFGGSNGTIDVTVTGGTPGYTYNWGGGLTTQDRSSLTAGTYTVTVTDANNCTATISATVTQPSDLNLSISVTNAACFGGSDGTIDVTVTGGTTPYTYVWSDGPVTTQDRSGLAIGTYTVTVTDANNCTATISATVTQPTALNLSISVTNAACFGGSNGAIDLTVTGGTPAYTYDWGGGLTTQDRIGLTAGLYTVTVTDANGCTAAYTVNVQQPAILVINPAITDVACGGNTGAISVGPISGWTYLWSTGSTAPSLSNLPVGTYTVTVSDANGCPTTLTTTLGMKLSIVATQPATCFAGATGSLDLTVTNGSGDYTYQWSNGPITEDQSSLAPDTYTVTVTEALGCTATASATILQPATLEIAAFVLNQPCGGAFSGKLKLDVTSGQAPPYDVTWSNGSASGSKNGIPGEPFTVSGLGLGNYAITLTNASGCSATTSATLTSAAPLVLTTVVTNTSCFGGSDGSIDLTVTGGTSGYITLWSNGSTTEDQTNLPPGTYTTTVTDVNGCSATTSATVGEPTRLTATVAVTNVACFGGQNGAIDLTVTGGVPPYTYNWTHTVNTEDVQNLSFGTYIVTVTDANGCSTTASATVNQPAQQVLAVASVTPTSTCTANDGSLNLAAPAGSQPPYSFNFTNGPTSGNGSGLSIGGLSSGTYTITLTDGNGCTATTTAVQTSPMSATATTTATSICIAQDGAIQVSVSGQTSTNFIYTWQRGTQNGSGTAASAVFDISNLPQGNYVVEVRDDAGCFATVQAKVGQGVANLAALATASNTTCGKNNGMVMAAVSSGGMPVFSYLWSTGHPFSSLSGLAPGTYTVTVTEGGSGCTATSSATVGSSTSNIGDMTATPVAASCIGFGGGIIVDATGAVAPIIVSWVDAGGLTTGIQTVASLPYTIPNPIVNTVYTLTLTDERGCSATATTTVGTAGPALDATATAATTPSSCTAADGSVQVNIVGGTAPFSYAWSNGSQNGSGGNINTNSFDINGLKPGFHSITLTDVVGCQDFVGVEVKNPVSFGFDAPSL